MRGSISDTEYRALGELRHRIRHFIQEGDAAAQRSNLEPQQYLMLLAIRSLPPGEDSTIRTLAERMALKHHSTVELIDRMETHGLVRRSRSGADRREVFVSELDQFLNGFAVLRVRRLGVSKRRNRQARCQGRDLHNFHCITSPVDFDC